MCVKHCIFAELKRAPKDAKFTHAKMKPLMAMSGKGSVAKP